MNLQKKHIEITLVALLILMINAGLYLLLSILTDEGNFIWKDVSLLDKEAVSQSCAIIFRTKYYISFFTMNLLLAGAMLWYYDYAVGVWLLALGIVFYLLSVRFFAYYIAKQYVVIFEHQRVSEGYKEEPLLSGGYEVGYFVAPKLADKNYKGRIPALSALGKVGYLPAVPLLNKIMQDTSEALNVRGTAYLSLKRMGSTEALELMEDYTNRLMEVKDSSTYRYLEEIESGELN